MACTDRIEVGPVPVWSKTSSTWGFVPGSSLSVLNTVGIRHVRTSIELAASTGGIQLRAAFRTSNDGIGWGSPVEVSPQQQDTDGTAFGTSYVDLWDPSLGTNSLEQKQFVQFGFFVKLSSGSALEIAAATMRIDSRGV